MKRSIRFVAYAVAFMPLPASAAEVDFVRDIRPILSDKCYACHGPDSEQRQADLRLDTRDGAFAQLGDRYAIVAGKPQESELIRRISSDDIDELMPPSDHEKQLSDQERSLLESWVLSGAKWQEHWAYVAPAKPHGALSVASESVDGLKTGDELKPGSFIDALVDQQLESAGIAASSRADLRILFRRVHFDLTGLPPAPADVAEFISDPSDRAYEDAVDRLLDAPEYGERMAMYWLDLVRYADTVGYHGDQDISVSPFRDYVIAAFNANMPFDRFTREQLAGDLLDDPTQAQLIASGYNKLGMMSAEGGVQPKEYLAKYIAERVRTASAVWMGSTLGCAECHDHKFDPFTTEDFYRFAAFFADIKERGLYAGANRDGNWGPKVEVPDEELGELVRPIDQAIAKLQATLDTPTAELVVAQQAWEKQLASDLAWQILEPAQVTALDGVSLDVLDDQSVRASGPNPPGNTYTVTFKKVPGAITGLRMEVLSDDSLPSKGPGRASNGNFVLTELRVFVEPDAGERQPVPLSNAVASIEQSVAGDATPYGKWNAASAIDHDVKGSSWGWAILPNAGKANELTVEVTAPIEINQGSLVVVLEQNHTNPKHTIGRFRISTTSSPPPIYPSRLKSIPDEIRSLIQVSSATRTDAQREELASYYRNSVAPLLADVRQKLSEKRADKDRLIAEHTRTSLITVAVEPRQIRVLHRGNWMDESGDIVLPGVPRFMRQINSDRRATRADLAEWITANDNPLTARVFVNRLWKLFFGTGLSNVLDDLGSQGEPPTHPELLDALAVEFTTSDWDIKHMVKLIMMSRAYQRSSLMRAELQDLDPYNRLYARQSRFRLDAEVIRDNALAVSGLLVHKVGGRSVKPYQPAGLYRHLNFPQRQYEQDTDQNQYRRGLYTHWQRQFLHPAMKAFDAPAREECTASRPRSNTPLAALVLLNDPTYVEAARVFAERVMGSEKQTDRRIERMFAMALARPPAKPEINVLESLFHSQLQHFEAHPDDARQLIGTGMSSAPESLNDAELAAWTSVARVVFNMHEFITRN